ncbi:hypothetical protein, partial [Deinococcus sp.]|uniref:hypothetical protein n=1 Tax=Deinococcus sp. TaxID=47478 RepID=UPI00286E6774
CGRSAAIADTTSAMRIGLPSRSAMAKLTDWRAATGRVSASTGDARLATPVVGGAPVLDRTLVGALVQGGMDVLVVLNALRAR